MFAIVPALVRLNPLEKVPAEARLKLIVAEAETELLPNAPAALICKTPPVTDVFPL